MSDDLAKINSLATFIDYRSRSGKFINEFLRFLGCSIEYAAALYVVVVADNMLSLTTLMDGGVASAACAFGTFEIASTAAAHAAAH